MKKIILVRHGETKWNVEEIFRGRADIELNDVGVRQAELLADYLKDIKIEAVYSSPLRRALKTAEIVAQRHELALQVTPGLEDMDFGAWQGLSLTEVKDKSPSLYAQWLSQPDLVKIPQAEGFASIRQRAMAVVDQVIAKYDGTVVLVSHRVVNKILICALLGLDDSPFWEIRQDNCGITTFIHLGGRFVLDENNNTSYLQPLAQDRLGDF